MQEERRSGDQLLTEALDRQSRGQPAAAASLLVDRPWAEPPTSERLTVTYRRRHGQNGPVHEAVVDGRCWSLDDPQPLTPVAIPKPWGREIWYTGIEARGESRVGTDPGLPIGTYLALAPGHLSAGHVPVLLKILDPRPEPVLGELYLEVHESKQEVYVVTDVDPAAWPDGSGRIRYGISQSKRQQYDNDDDFRAAFLAALTEYERIRQQIDAGAGGLDKQEAAARAEARTFTDERPLAVGDVIAVPVWVPHSLQPGVRVVEFQTPTYERFILSSSQKVLTQNGWDSARAVAGMRLDTPVDMPPEPVSDHVQRIVRFDEFGVWQARAARALTLPESLPYALAFCVRGQTMLAGPGGGLNLGGGEAAFIPKRAIGSVIQGDADSLLLLAAPGL